MPGGFGWSGQNQNPYDRRASKGISEYNRATTLSIGHLWELPYGKGRRYGSTASPLAKAVLGGWAFNGVTLIYSGFPIAVNWGDASGLNSNFGQRPDAIGDPVISNPSRGGWYNPAAFANPAEFQFGNYGRNGGDLRGPGYFAADWALWKEFYFKETATLQVRIETMNIFNNTNLGDPNGTADSSVAGQIFSIDGQMRRMQFGLRVVF